MTREEWDTLFTAMRELREQGLGPTDRSSLRELAETAAGTFTESLPEVYAGSSDTRALGDPQWVEQRHSEMTGGRRGRFPATICHSAQEISRAFRSRWWFGDQHTATSTVSPSWRCEPSEDRPRPLLLNEFALCLEKALGMGILLGCAPFRSHRILAPCAVDASRIRIPPASCDLRRLLCRASVSILGIGRE